MPMIKLVQTCAYQPEQYDAFLDGVQVGYLRLRHGYFSVNYPNVDGEYIYEASPKGGACFDSDERDYYLRFAVDAIQRRHAHGERLPAPDVVYEICTS